MRIVVAERKKWLHQLEFRIFGLARTGVTMLLLPDIHRNIRHNRIELRWYDRNGTRFEVVHIAPGLS
jgi:hypothetical protein